MLTMFIAAWILYLVRLRWQNQPVLVPFLKVAQTDLAVDLRKTNLRPEECNPYR